MCVYAFIASKMYNMVQKLLQQKKISKRRIQRSRVLVCDRLPNKVNNRK